MRTCLTKLLLSMHPICKFCILVGWTLSVLALDNLGMVLIVAVVSMSVYVGLGCDVRILFRAWLMLALMVLVILIAGTLSFDGTAQVPMYGSFGLSVTGLLRATCASVKFLLLVLFSLLFCQICSSSELMDALACLFRPLRRLGFPVDDVQLLLTIAVRTIPLCADKLEQLRRAQNIRGARIGLSRNPVKMIISYVPLMIPLVVLLFQSAEKLSEALVVRSYGVMPRTLINESPVRARDAGLSVVLLFAAVVAGIVW